MKIAKYDPAFDDVDVEHIALYHWFKQSKQIDVTLSRLWRVDSSPMRSFAQPIQKFDARFYLHKLCKLFRLRRRASMDYGEYWIIPLENNFSSFVVLLHRLHFWSREHRREHKIRVVPPILRCIVHKFIIQQLEQLELIRTNTRANTPRGASRNQVQDS